MNYILISFCLLLTSCGIFIPDDSMELRVPKDSVKKKNLSIEFSDVQQPKQ